MEDTTFVAILGAVALVLFLFLCVLVVCLVRRCCPIWMSEKIEELRERINKTDRHNYSSKRPSLFSNSNRAHPTRCKRNIPIVIVSDENGKRVMTGKDVCVYEKQDLEEIL